MAVSSLPAAAQPSLLLVDDDPTAIQLMGGILTDVAVLRFATNGKDALRVARELAPDLILLDAEMPEISGFQLMEMLKGEPDLADVPVIFITSHTEAGFEVSALQMGAADFIAKPFRSSLMLARVKSQLRSKRLTDRLRHVATTDPLTGVANRRAFDDSLAEEWLRVRNTGRALSLLLIDVDDEKTGDESLTRLAAALLAARHRPGDLVARYGGREFMMLLPETTRADAERIAGRVRESVRTTRCASVCVGVACHEPRAAPAADHCQCTPGHLLLAADRALYAARHVGLTA
jgi:diguanylate cyclase (GGDEF)-like protein